MVGDRAGFERAWADIGDAAPVVVVVVCGHGDRKQLAGRSEATSWLLVGDTDPTEQSATSVDLDAAVHDLRARLASPLVLVLDACHVDVRTSLGGAAPAVVLLASPSGEAEVGRDGPLLTRAFGRALSQLGGPSASLDDVLARTCSDVEHETARRQRPTLRYLGDRRFLAAPVRQVSAGAPAAAVGARLAAMVNTDQLPQAALDALWRDVRDETAGRELFELHLALAAHALHPRPTREDLAKVRTLLAGAGAISPRTRAGVLHWVGWARNQIGEAEYAAAHLCEALEQLERDPDPLLESRVRNTLGTVYRSNFSFEQADRQYAESMRQKESLGDEVGVEMTRLMRGWLLVAKGLFDDAAQTFSEGLQRIHERLGVGARSPDEAIRLVESLLFLLVGRCVTMLFLPTQPEEFKRLRDTLAPWTSLYRSFTRSGGRAPFQEAQLLLSLGARDGRPFQFSPGKVEIDAWWAAVRDVVVRGDGDLAGLRNVLQREPTPGDLIATRMKQLAGLHHLAVRMESERVAKLRDGLLVALRGRGFVGLPTVGGAPWSWDARSLSLDTSEWCDWGPLRAQLEETRRSNVLLTSVVTEQYLQLLAWVSALFLLLDAGAPATRALAILDRDNPDGSRVMLSLGQALTFCRRVVDEVTTRSPWADRLASVWRDPVTFQDTGYGGWNEVSQERNALSHHRVATFEVAQRVLDRHALLISRICGALEGHDVRGPVADPGGTVAEDLVVARLANSRGGMLSCGPLLLLHAKDNTAFYVPHSLPRGLLRGQEDEEKATFHRYSLLGRSDTPDRVRVRWERSR